MYKVTKERGNNANVTLVNSDTKASVIVGKLTMDILKMLEDNGYKFDPDTEEAIPLRDAWSLEVSSDTAKKLSEKAMKMNKPVREQSKKSEPKVKQVVDAMDVLLGLASYK